MPIQKIKSLQDIKQLQQKLLAQAKAFKARILICMTGCRALGAESVVAKFKESLKARSLDKQVAVVETGCIGMCAKAPVV